MTLYPRKECPLVKKINQTQSANEWPQVKKINQTQSANEWPQGKMAFLVSVNHLIVLLFFIFYVTSFGSLHLYKSIIIQAILTYGLAHFTCISPTHKSQGLML